VLCGLRVNASATDADSYFSDSSSPEFDGAHRSPWCWTLVQRSSPTTSSPSWITSRMAHDRSHPP